METCKYGNSKTSLFINWDKMIINDQITAKQIQHYSKYSTPELIYKAERHFNKFIRLRDRNGDYFYCPTCKSTKKILGDNYQACHFFPAGQFSWHKFNEDNVFGGCKSCNYYKHGAGYSFGYYVKEKIGEERYLKLEYLNGYYRQRGFKWDRIALIEIIEKYKAKNKKF